MIDKTSLILILLEIKESLESNVPVNKIYFISYSLFQERNIYTVIV